MPSIFEDPVILQGAEDEWEGLLYECSYAGIRIDVMSTRDSNGRALAPFESINVDGASIDDNGAAPRVVTARVGFFRVADNDRPTSRFHQFRAAVHTSKVAKEPEVFVHPITGAMKVFVGQFDWSASAEERETIWVDCSFHEHRQQAPTWDPESGAPALISAEEVAATAAAVDASVETFNTGRSTADRLQSAVPQECATTIARWQELDDNAQPIYTSRSVHHELTALSDKLQALTDEWELATDVSRYEILVSLNALHASIRRAARVVLEDTPRIVEFRIVAPMPLLPFLARTYGARMAETMAEQFMRLNVIPNPARLETGLVLRGPSREAASSVRSAR
jgi:hypothetical protein